MHLHTWVRKILRDFWAYKLRSLLVSTSVFIGVLGIVVLTTMGQLLTRQLHADIQKDELAMLRIYLRLPAGEGGDPQDLTPLLDVAGVEDVEAQAAYRFAWKMPGEREFRTGQVFAYSEPFGEIDIEPIRLLEGTYPQDGHDELLIEKRMAEKYGLQVGDSIPLRISSSPFLHQANWHITGIVFQPYVYVGSVSDSSVYTTYNNAQKIVGFDGYSSIYVRFENFGAARQTPPTFYRILERETPYRVIFHLLDNPDENAFIVGVDRFNRILTIIAIVAMVVASFLVTNVINTLLAEQRRQIGAMKAIGATYWDIVRMYLGLAFLYGLCGTLPAVALGVVLGRAAAIRVAPLANTFLDNPPFSAWAIGIGLLLGIGVPMIAAIGPIYATAGITIVEAMTDQGISARYGKNALEKLVQRLPLKLEAQQALNNVVRQRGRLLLTIVSLSLAVAAFMGMFAVFDSLNRVITEIRESLDYEVSFLPNELEVAGAVQGVLASQEEQIRTIQPGVAIELTVLPEVVSANVAADGRVDEQEDEDEEDPDEDTDVLVVTGVDPAVALTTLDFVEGEAWQRDPAQAGIVITPEIAELYEKSVGDTLRIRSPNNERDFEIIGIADFPLETAFMEWQQLAEFVGVIREAPIPNAYWDTVQIEVEGSQSPLEDREFWAVGIDEQVGTYLQPGFNPEEPGAIISEALALAGGYQVGDTITLQTEAEAIAYPVQAIVEVNPVQLRGISRDIPEPILESDDEPQMVALHWEELARLEGLDYRALSPNTFYVDLANPTTPSTLPPEGLAAPRVAAVHENQTAFADRIAQTILGVGLVMNMASLMMAVVGGIGLLAITSIGVFERQREIGVMRSVGATSSNILFQFILEGVVVGILAWVIGIPISLLLSQVLIEAVPFREVITFRYPPLAPALGLVGVLLITLLATIYPSWTAAQRTVAEILRYQ